MEQTRAIAKAEQQKSTSSISLQNISQRIIKTGEKKYELSEYIPGEATGETVIWMLKKLKGCFPETSREALDTLVEMLKEERWADTRIKDAVKEAIKSHKYPRITPANILDFDKRVKLYSINQLHQEAYQRNGHNLGATKGFKEVTINGWRMYYNEKEHKFANGLEPEPFPERYRIPDSIDGHTSSEETKRTRAAMV